MFTSTLSSVVEEIPENERPRRSDQIVVLLISKVPVPLAIRAVSVDWNVDDAII